MVVPLPQRTSRSASGSMSNVQAEQNRVQLKRKVPECGDRVHPEGSAVKIVRNGLNELKIEQLKRNRAMNDDPMDGSTAVSKRKPITWP